VNRLRGNSLLLQLETHLLSSAFAFVSVNLTHQVTFNANHGLVAATVSYWPLFWIHQAESFLLQKRRWFLVLH
jgi:hypothetical protein